MAKESKIKLKDGTTVKITGGGNKDNASVSFYQGNYKNKDAHSAIHVNINSKAGKGSIVEHGENHSNITKTPIQCYLTTACMEKLKEKFDDDCYELNILRWFRDNFVSDDDINHYYSTAPIIVNAINEYPNYLEIYNSIYENIILFCIKAIENGQYELAYERYRSSVLVLEEQFARPILNEHLIRCLTKAKNSSNH